MPENKRAVGGRAENGMERLVGCILVIHSNHDFPPLFQNLIYIIVSPFVRILMRFCYSMVAHFVPIVAANSCDFGRYLCFRHITFMICKRLSLSSQLDHQQTTYFYSIVGPMLSASFVISLFVLHFF